MGNCFIEIASGLKFPGVYLFSTSSKNNSFRWSKVLKFYKSANWIHRKICPCEFDASLPEKKFRLAASSQSIFLL